MSMRLDPSWIVMDSIENPQHDRCVDIFTRPDGSVGFEEFRRDAEDAGAWTPGSYFCGLRYASKGDALADAARRVAWLALAIASPFHMFMRINTLFGPKNGRSVESLVSLSW
jgi:hypothetical protein